VVSRNCSDSNKARYGFSFFRSWFLADQLLAKRKIRIRRIIHNSEIANDLLVPIVILLPSSRRQPHRFQRQSRKKTDLRTV
jgi:hypothetical protein